MKSMFYPRLALQNIVKNRRFHVPYLLTCVFSAAMFYNLNFITNHPGIMSMKGGSSVNIVLSLGCWVVGIFSVIFLFYTNSFLIKSRKRELGLYNILGMEKKNIARFLLWETLFSAASSLAVGLGVGIAVSKLMLMILMRLLRFDAPLNFMVSVPGVTGTLELFAFIFLVNLIRNLCGLSLSRPIELLKGTNVGEKEPRAKWLVTLVGLASLVGGYVMALMVQRPADAAVLFFLAVILVIIGTYCLFISGSISLLKGLRRNKRYYYQTRHFTAVSGMLYRMKQNAAGLASICILCTMVLVTISTTVCLYRGENDILKNRFPRDVVMTTTDQANAWERQDEIMDIVGEKAEKSGLTVDAPASFSSLTFFAELKDGALRVAGDGELIGYSDLWVCLIPEKDYVVATGAESALLPGHMLAYVPDGSMALERLTLQGINLAVDQYLPELKLDQSEAAGYAITTLYLILPQGEWEKQLSLLEACGKLPKWKVYFDLTGGDDEAVLACYEKIVDRIDNSPLTVYYECRQANIAEFYALYGGLFFIGLFLGAIFLMATVLIIYYKQISEGYDDKARYEIMQKVGMSRKEVRESIRTQVLTVFFLPLIASVIHLAFAFKMITKILVVFNLTDIGLFALCTAATILIFAAGYTAIYLFTARTYYKIVES